MSKARLVITAVIVEKRSVSRVAGAYGVARSWIYTLLARYRAEGEAAFKPRSRRPLTSPAAISAGAVELIVTLRKELSGQGCNEGRRGIRRSLSSRRVGADDPDLPRPPATALHIGPGRPKPQRPARISYRCRMASPAWTTSASGGATAPEA
jgi:leucine-zipper of insertion element IS481